MLRKLLVLLLVASSLYGAAVTSTGTHNLGNSRSVVRDDGAIIYVGVEQSDGTDRIEIWKDGTDGSSFTEQQADAETRNDFVATATDSAGDIHVIYHNSAKGTYGIFYRKYTTSTDTWSGETGIAGNVTDSVSVYGLSIAVDSNDVPHVAGIDAVSTMGTVYDTLFYVNQVGGSWNTQVEVEGGTAEKNCRQAEILIDESNLPVIVYRNDTDGAVTAAIGNVNNATSFTLHDVDTTSITAEPVSVAIDSGGDVWVGYVRSNNVYLAEHQNADGWTTWQTPVTNSNGAGGTGVSLAIEGTTVYVFYEEDAGNDIAYDVYTGSWAGETIAQAGTFNSVRVKWARYADFDSCSEDRGGSSGRAELDYLYVDETASPDVLHASLSLTSCPAGSSVTHVLNTIFDD